MAIINGTNFDNKLQGTLLADTINGFGGQDILFGYGGDDILDGGPGLDVLVGGVGNDLYILDGPDFVAEGPNEGIDTIRTNGGITRASHLSMWKT